MNKSKIVTVRLSNDELEAIEKSKEKLGIKSQNDFIRFSAAFFISLTDTMIRLVTSQDLISRVDKFNNEFKAELEKVPSTKAKLQEKIF